MKVFTCTDFPGHWPVGVAAVIIAENEAAADRALRADRKRAGLPINDPVTLTEVDTESAQVLILRDGDY